jgi:hypothetical protein
VKLLALALLLTTLIRTTAEEKNQPKLYDRVIHRSEFSLHPDVIISTDYGTTECNVDESSVSSSAYSYMPYVTFEDSGQSFPVLSEGKGFICKQSKKLILCAEDTYLFATFSAPLIEAKKHYQARVIQAQQTYHGFRMPPGIQTFVCVPTTSTISKKGKSEEHKSEVCFVTVCCGLSHRESRRRVARPGGLELPTFWFVGGIRATRQHTRYNKTQ